MLTLSRLLNNVDVLAVVCNQFGDTGKGKLSDYFAPWAHIIARGTGGANAGHTIRIKDKEYVFHLLPCGILHDCSGKVNMIGRGVAFDPRIACSELAILDREGLSFENLRISCNAKLVLPQHLVMDRLRESALEERIGSTRKGIGPCYVDHYGRAGLVVSDLLDPDTFKDKLEKNVRDKRKLLSLADPERVKEILHQEDLENGRFYRADGFFNQDAIIARYCEYGNVLKDHITDTDQLVREALAASKRILLEGAQGNLLSIDHGTYPHVTACDTTVAGLARGAGLRERDIDLTLGILKGFYMTRVGDGAFPTELGGKTSEHHCNMKGVSRDTEQKYFTAATVNDPDEFRQGVAIRITGNEYGATTGRPRRIGWLDLPLTRYSMQFSGPNVVLTKLDVLDEVDTIKVAGSYTYQGPDYCLGDRTLRKGSVLTTAIADSRILRSCVPMYDEFPGWKRTISGMRSIQELPKELRAIMNYLERAAKLNIVMVSVGPERDQTILVKNRMY